MGNFPLTSDVYTKENIPLTAARLEWEAKE